MAQLLEKFFFPKWIETLVFWLNRSPNLDQVSRWYAGWKSEIPKEILQQPGVTGLFNVFLNPSTNTTHNFAPKTFQSRKLPTCARTDASFDWFVSASRSATAPDTRSTTSTDGSTNSAAAATWIQRTGLTKMFRTFDFVRSDAGTPGIGQTGNGSIHFLSGQVTIKLSTILQVYRVGKIFCYIDRSVVMISDGSFTNWTPVSLQTLLERAISGNIF